MSSLFSQTPNCFCAFCRTPRRVSIRKRMGVVNVLLSVLTGMLISFIWFQGFDPRAMLFIVLSLMIGEMFVQIRWRLAIVCKTCGFDPVTYVKDPEKAAVKVKNFLDEKKNDPNRLLSRPLNLPTITPERLEQINAEKKPGRLLSRTL